MLMDETMDFKASRTKKLSLLTVAFALAFSPALARDVIAEDLINTAADAEVVNGLTGGPDAFGYTAIDESEPGGPAFNFIDISGSGTSVVTGDDTASGPIALPGPPFPFYGVDYTLLNMSSNGYITTDDTGDL